MGFGEDAKPVPDQASASTPAEIAPQGFERESDLVPSPPSGLTPEANQALNDAFKGLLGTPGELDRTPQTENDFTSDEPRRLATDAPRSPNRGSPSAQRGGDALTGQAQRVLQDALRRAGLSGKGVRQAVRPAQGSGDVDGLPVADQSAALIAWARDNGHLLDSAEFDARHRSGSFKRGQEHEVVIVQTPVGTRILKRNYNRAYGPLALNADYAQYLARIQLHNALFPDTSLRLEGFMEMPKGLAPVISQEFVRIDEGAPLSPDQVDAFMRGIGFLRTGEKTFVNRDGLVVDDLHAQNIIRDANGVIRVIDPVIRQEAAPADAAPLDDATDEDLTAPLGTPAETPQDALPADRLPAFLKAAQALIASGITTPDALARVLDKKFAKAARRHSEALWDAFGMVRKDLRGTHDWSGIYAGLDAPAVLRSAAKNAKAKTAKKTTSAPPAVTREPRQPPGPFAQAVLDGREEEFLAAEDADTEARLNAPLDPDAIGGATNPLALSGAQQVLPITDKPATRPFRASIQAELERLDAEYAKLDSYSPERTEEERDANFARMDTINARVNQLSEILSELEQGEIYKIKTEEERRLKGIREKKAEAYAAALQDLPDRPRDILRRRDAGQSFDEIGAAYNVDAARAESLYRSALGLTKARVKRALRAARGVDTLGTPAEPPRSEDDAIRDELAALRAETGFDSARAEANYQKAIAEASGERTVGDPRLANPGLSDETRAVTSAVDEQRREDMERESHELWRTEAERRIAADFPGVVRDLLEQARSGGDIAANPVGVKSAQLAVERLSREAVTTGDAQKLRDAQTLAYAYRIQGSEQARALAARRDPFKTPEQRYREFFAGIIFTPPAPARKAIAKAWTPREKARRIEELTRQLDSLRVMLAKRTEVVAKPQPMPTPTPNRDPEADATVRRLRARLAEVEKELADVRARLDREEQLHDVNAKRLQKINRVLSKMGVTVADLFAGDAIVRLRNAKIIENVASLQNWDATKKRFAKLAAEGWDKASILRKLGLTEAAARRVYEELRRDMLDRARTLAAQGLDAASVEAVTGTLGSPPEADGSAALETKAEELLAAMGLPAWGELDSPIRKARVQQAEQKRKEARERRQQERAKPPPAPLPGEVAPAQPPAPSPDAWADDADALPPTFDPRRP
ncbi:MAG: hypothetical protein ACRCTI_02570, partial [Beijerinckiaceae bacterium]